MMTQSHSRHLDALLLILFALFLTTSVATGADDLEPTGKPTPEDGFVLNFDDADLFEVVRIFADQLKINYIVDSSVKGKVTIHTSGVLTKAELFPIFHQILEINGLTIVKEGSLFKIEKIKEASRMNLPLLQENQPIRLSPHERMVIQIIPLKYIAGEEITKILTPFISASGTIISHADSKNLIVVDNPPTIEKLLRLIKVFDINVFEAMRHRVFKPQHQEAEELSKSLDAILKTYGKSVTDRVSVIPLSSLESLLILSRDDQVFEKIEQLIQLLDVPAADINPKIYIYSVKNGAAVELAGILENVFAKGDSSAKKASTEGAKADGSKAPSGPFGILTSPIAPAADKPAAIKEARPAFSAGDGGSGTLKGDIRITADEIRNALIIEALPNDYLTVKTILEKLDVLPRQVLIEVTIAEISLDDSSSLGVEWTYIKGAGEGLSTSLLNAYMGATGMKYVIGQANRWSSALSALATEKRVNILSSPSVLASDNKEAKINVSTEIPVASTQYQRDSTSTPILETTVQYRNTGVILSVTPHINEFGLVSMDISQEVSEASGSVQVGNQSMPSFFKRSVNTSLTVNNGQTIVIGGLIRETQSDGFSGVPCIGKVPLLNFIFGKISKTADKTELIILITPRVISTLEDVDRVTQEFKAKVGMEIQPAPRP